MDDLMIKIENVSKQYKLGQIGGTTLKEELQRKHAKLHGKEDPTKKIGTKDYVPGETFMALQNVSFTVKKGERIGIIGHNGAGKSTLLKLISRVTAPTDGRICLNGRITSMLEVGTGFHQELTGRENIYMNGAILGMTKKEIDETIEDIIDFSEVRQFIDTPVKRYSSGMYVKLAFSVAAHLKSEIMIMDEVLAVGDMAFQEKCLEKMKTVSEEENRTILYVSHNMNTIRQLCERCIVLNNGQIVYDGDVEDAVNIYLGRYNLNDFPISYDFPYRKSTSIFGKIIKLNSCRILNKEQAVFEVGEKTSILLNISSKQNAEGIQVAFVLCDSKNYFLGTTCSEKFNLSIGEEQLISFSLPFECLAYNDYYLNFQIIKVFDNGSVSYFDNPAANVLLRYTNQHGHGLEWHREWLGTISFPISKLLSN